ncbi:MAG: hypothetical protein U5L76_01630 [Patescibacteria group bacterium]|nr:hypothetical protein [Patescibacteria group bacterium]
MEKKSHQEIINFLKSQKNLYLMWMIVLVAEIAALLYTVINLIAVLSAGSGEFSQSAIGFSMVIISFALVILLSIVIIWGIYKVEKWVIWLWVVSLIISLGSFDWTWVIHLALFLIYYKVVKEVNKFKETEKSPTYKESAVE